MEIIYKQKKEEINYEKLYEEKCQELKIEKDKNNYNSIIIDIIQNNKNILKSIKNSLIYSEMKQMKVLRSSI